MQINGKLNEIRETKSPKFKTLIIDGDMYGVDTLLVKDLKVGDYVSGTSEEQGKFNNITSIMVASKNEAAVKNQKQTKDADRNFYADMLFDSMSDVYSLYISPDFKDEFKSKIDWTDLVCSMFISRSKR